MLNIAQLGLGGTKVKDTAATTVVPKAQDSPPIDRTIKSAKAAITEEPVVVEKIATSTSPSSNSSTTVSPVVRKAELPALDRPGFVCNFPAAPRLTLPQRDRKSLLFLNDDEPAHSPKEFKPVCGFAAEKKSAVVRNRIEVVLARSCHGLSGTFGEIVQRTDFLDLLQSVAEQRFRMMPHQGSRLDLTLRWAASVARSINDCSLVFGHGIHGLDQFARLSYGSIRLLVDIAVASDASAANIFSLFSVLQQMSTVLDYFGHKRQFVQETESLLAIVATSCAELLDFFAGLSVYSKASSKSLTRAVLRTMQKKLSVHVESFYARKASLVVGIWEQSLRQHHVKLTISIETLQAWLSVKVQRSSSSRFARHLDRSHRHEQTFEWFYDVLKSFRHGREDLLLITAQPASGKSMLLSYILEQLECPKAGLGDCDVVKYDFAGTAKAAASVLSLLKAVSGRLSDVQAGNHRLYRALQTAHAAERNTSKPKSAEIALWTAVEEAVKALNRPLVFLIDSLDRCSEPEAVYKKFQTIARSSKHCQFILSARSADFETDHYCRHLDLEAHNHVDIRHYFEHELLRLHFTEEHRHLIVRECTSIKIESFLQAQLFLQIIRRQRTLDAVRAVLVKLSGHFHEQLDLCLDMVDFDADDTRLIFSVLLTSRRPLTVAELSQLLMINVKTRSVQAKEIDVEDIIRERCGGLVSVRSGRVSLTHDRIYDYLLVKCRTGKLSFTIAEAHKSLTVRALIYLKHSFGGFNVEPSFDCSFGTDKSLALDKLMEQHGFLDYAAESWIYHYRYSSWYELDESPKEFKDVFPAHVALAIFEGSSWHAYYHTDEVESFYRLSLELRRQALGHKHKAVLQSRINVCHVEIRASHTVRVHAEFYEVWKLSVEVCGKKSAFCAALAEYYIELVMKLETHERREHHGRCEELYKFLWEHYKHVHGEQHETTLHFAYCLAEHYILVEKHEIATTILREIHTITVKYFGHLHERSTKITQLLITVLTKTERHDECLTLCEGIIRAAEEQLDCWHADRLRMTLRMVEICEHEKHHDKAESILIALRLKLIEACAHRHKEHIHTAKIEITLQLALFYRRCRREKEAQKLLIDLWAEYEKPIHGHHHHGHDILIKIKSVGQLLKEWGLFSVAKSVFGALCGWFKKSEKKEEIVEVTIALSHCHHHCKDVESEGAVLIELYELLIKSCTTEVIETTVVITAVELVTYYERERRWTEAKEVCVTIIRKIWADFFTARGFKCGLPREHRDETIALVLKLARIHVHLGSTSQAMSYYLSIFKSCKLSLSLEHHHVFETAEYLVTCYEEHGMVDEAIEVWQHFRHECHNFLGQKHELTIRVLYKLAHFCQRHSLPGAERYFLDIAVAFGIGERACHSSAVEAVLFLCRLYQKQRHDVTVLKKCYYSLWLAFKARGTSCGLDQQVVVDIFSHYLIILRSECTLSEVIEWVSDYRKACLCHFGASHWITVKISMEIAALLTVEEHRHEEAIALYELILKHERSIEIIIRIKQQLAVIYTRHERYHLKAEIVLRECWEAWVKIHSHAHERSLEFLVQYVDILIKLGHKEKATTHLYNVIISIFKQTTITTKQLYACALTLSRLYAKLEQTSVLLKLVVDIRAQLITGSRSGHAHFGGLITEGHIVRENLLLFLVTLNSFASGLSLNYEECLVLVYEEKALWQSWIAVRSVQSNMCVVLAAGVHLLHFLIEHHRQGEADQVLNIMWTVFCKELSIKGSVKGGAAYDFFTLYISTPIADGCLAGYLSAAVEIISYLYTSRSFALCLSLARWFHEHVRTHKGGYKSIEMQAFGFRLAFCLSGRSHREILCLDKDLRAFGEVLFLAVLEAKLSVSDWSSFHSCEYEELESIILILGERRSYKQLEQILNFIWETRNASRLDSTVLLSVAYRLVEVRFAAGKHLSAIALAEDIVYNLRRVYGPAHPMTVHFSELLGNLCEDAGEHRKAARVRCIVLQSCLPGDNDDDSVSIEYRARIAYKMVDGCSRLSVDDAESEFSTAAEAAKKAFEDVDDDWKSIDTSRGCGFAQLQQETLAKQWQAPRAWTLATISAA